MSTGWTINWDRGEADVQALGGMMGPARFAMSDGRIVQPLFVAPWADEDGAKDLPGILRRLRGEWPCVPFGAERAEIGPEWNGRAPAIGDGEAHGHGANHDWHLVAKDTDWIEIAIDYPKTHPIRHLSRRISGRSGATVLDMRLRVEARAPIDLGIALHPTFRLPDEPGAATLDIAGVKWGMSFPQPLDITTAAAAGARFEQLDRIPAATGGNLDFTRLPQSIPNEDLVQVRATGGVARLTNQPERYAVSLEYDADLFSSLVLWLPNCGCQDFPWSGRTRALGIEPARAAFDLGQPCSADPSNPLARSGILTSVRVEPGAPLTTKYTISVESTE